MTSVSTSAFYDGAVYNLTKLRKQTEDLQVQISTGDKIVRSYDDPLAAAQMRALQASDTLAAADKSNTNLAKTRLTQTDNTLSEFSNIVIDIQRLATQAASSTLSTTDRAAVGAQIAAYYNNLTNLTNVKDTNGDALFAGQGTGAAYTLDASGNATYNGSASAATIDLGPGLSVTTGVTGPEFVNFTSGGTSKDLLSVVKNLASALQNPTSTADAIAAAQGALTDLNAGLEAVTTTQTVVGARLAWLNTTADMQTQMKTQRASLQSSIGGTDITEAAAKLTQQMTVLEASQASFVKLANLSLFSMLN
jgi:flagellar hook-associated protein 3 FlgL